MDCIVMIEDRLAREIEPFSYFPGHASAIAGLGGTENGPDPNYCFHTPYNEYVPGIVMLKVRLMGARATEGELAIRVHAYRPDSDLDISLVTGTRMPLGNADGTDLEATVRVAAVPGVTYALYGYFSEKSDLDATGLTITAQETGDNSADDYIFPETTRSLFEGASVDMPNRLIADGSPSFAHPVSQPLTVGQIESIEYTGSWPEIPLDHEGQVKRWRQAFALQTLDTYGFLRDGSRGLLLASEELPIASAIKIRGCALSEVLVRAGVSSKLDQSDIDQLPGSVAVSDLETMGSFDFAIAITTDGCFPDKATFFNLIAETLRHVLRGGVGVFLFDHVADGAGYDARKIAGGFLPHRREIEQLALIVISRGSDVAQLSFADSIGTDRPTAEICPFGLIVRR